MSTGFSKIQFGDALTVTEPEDGVIRVDGAGAVGATGPAGPAGSPGAPGPPGAPGTDANYVHTQLSPSATWTVTHGLGKYAAVDVTDSGGTVIIPDVTYLDLNTVTLGFASATSGKAVFN